MHFLYHWSKTHLLYLVPVPQRLHLQLGHGLCIEDVGVLGLLQVLLGDAAGPQELLVGRTEGLSDHHGCLPGLHTPHAKCMQRYRHNKQSLETK